MVKYQLQIYAKGSTFVMPLVTVAVFLYAMYSMKPLDVVSGFLVSSIFVFFLMIWVGMMFAQKENTVMEQLLYLRMQKAGKYYFKKAISLLCIALFAALFCTFFPVMQNVINGYDMFKRQVTIDDVANVFLLQCGCAFCGVAMGNFLHPRLMQDRKGAILLTVFFSILTICRHSIEEHIPLTKIILWVLPPILGPSQVYGKEVYFDMTKTVGMFMTLCVYAVGYGVVKSWICYKRKF